MNECFIYIAFFVYGRTPKSLYNHVGGGGSFLNHHQCAASIITASTTESLHVGITLKTLKLCVANFSPWATKTAEGSTTHSPSINIVVKIFYAVVNI